MRYKIFTKDIIDHQIGAILKNEIERFDIRAEVLLKDYSSSHNLSNTDIVVFIGSKLFRSQKSYPIPCFFLYQSYKKIGKRIKKIKPATNLNVIDDLSFVTKDLISDGSFLFDWFRTLTSVNKQNGNEPHIVVLPSVLSKEKSLTILSESLIAEFKNFSIKLVDRHSLIGSPQIIKNATAAVVSCSFGEMVAIYFNVPYVRIVKKSYFVPNEISALNFISGTPVVKEYPIRSIPKILVELDHLLNDHQYYATVMEKFQEVKGLIGKPAARDLAKRIVNSVEM